MKRFRFTLEALRILRQRQEQDALEVYAKALLERQKAQDHLQQLKRQQAELEEETRREMSAGCQVHRLRQRQVFHESLRLGIRAQEQKLSLAEMGVQRAMQALVQAKQRREAVDNAHDRQKTAHGKQALREEAAMLDELAQRQLGESLRGQFA
jgi:flagellar export protein FliJ